MKRLGIDVPVHVDCREGCQLSEARAALARAIAAMENVTVFVTSRQRIMKPTGEEWWADEIAAARAALTARPKQ